MAESNLSFAEKTQMVPFYRQVNQKRNGKEVSKEQCQSGLDAWKKVFLNRERTQRRLTCLKLENASVKFETSLFSKWSLHKTFLATDNLRLEK